MGNQIRLYYTQTTDTKKWELIAGKLLVVDNIASYLNQYRYFTRTNFQYIKNDLEISINVDLSQDYSQPLTSPSIKYVAIQNEGEKKHYYYVKNAIWRSKSAVRLDLVLDVLNTFEEGTDYTFKANTKINREHKDRFIQRDVTLTLTYEEVIESTGIFTTGNTLTIKYQVSGIEYTICSGSITSVGLDTITIDMSNSYEISEVLSLLNEYESYIILRQSASIQWIVSLGSVSHDSKLYRKIDEVPENLNPQLFNASNKGESIQNNVTNLRGDWYLLYRNQNNPSEAQATSLVNPVDCYLIPSKTDIQVDSGVVLNGRIIPSFLDSSKYYFFRVEAGQTYTTSDGHSCTPSTFTIFGVVLIFTAGSKLSVQFIDVSVDDINVKGSYDCDYLTITGLPARYSIQNYGFYSHSFLTNLSFDQTLVNSTEYTTLDDITLLDRTDAKNIKLIKLPYCPYNFSFDNGIMEVGDEDYWELTTLSQSTGDIHILRLKDLNLPLSSTLEVIGSNNPFLHLYFNQKSIINPSINNLRKDSTYESKLYNSEFRYNSFYYDSFAMRIQLEKCDLTQYIGYSNRINKTTINFDCTKTINSRFLFTFANYYLKNGEQNFNQYLPIARNNEEVLYNVPYINYIRTGFNYDVKAKQQQSESNWLGAGLSTIATASALLLPSAPLKVAGVVAGIISIAQSVKNAVYSDLSAQNSLDQKLTQYKNQSASVVGSDDVDLMSIYADNRLKVMKYRPREETENLIFNLFFYAGYKSERMGIPNHNTRVRFDYLECEAMIQTISSIPSDCLEELINCFKNGVTYIHKTNGATAWDMEQKYENWEKSLLED